MLIAVITYAGKGSYADDQVLDEDELLAQILIALDLEFKFEVWSDPEVNWEKYSLLLLKSPWDYFDRYPEFLAWCKNIQQLGIPCHNDLKTVIWNSDKRYLEEIGDKGFPVVPTQFFNKGIELDLNPVFKLFASENLVFKPTVSGGSKNTLKLEKKNWEEQKKHLETLLKKEDFMVQPFINEVVETGEYSYVFFSGRFSHAVLKSPQAGEFRVQHFFGGKIRSIDPDIDQISTLQKLVDNFAKNCLYARVDGVWIEGVFFLMELELIEPYLFLFTHPDAIRNYKEALRALLVKA